MGRDLNPKCRQCRRLGHKLFLRGERCFGAKCAMVKRNYPPGIHGQKGLGRKTTEYGKQLAAKQTAKKIFRLREQEFHNYFIEAGRLQGDTSINFLTLLERRLDNVVYRCGLSSSRDQARQLVSHGHFLVNGRQTDIPSYQLKPKDIITINPNSKKNKIISEYLKNINQSQLPDWLNWEPKSEQAQIIALPEQKHFDPGIDARLIIGFYSR